MIRMSAQEVYEALLSEERITEIEGQIRFYLGTVDIVVRQRDVVGNIIQEWLQGWFDTHEVLYCTNDNSQMPPDFFLNPQNRKTDMLEVKAFNIEASPGFDIADFNMYQQEIVEKPWMLYVDYLIFGYEMMADGTVLIRDLWLKKVWEITRRMKEWPINLQIKDRVVHKIRPGVFYKRIGYPSFRTIEDFISAIEETVYKNPKTHDTAGQWLNQFLGNYEYHYGVRLNVPRWRDIADTYQALSRGI